MDETNKDIPDSTSSETAQLKTASSEASSADLVKRYTDMQKQSLFKMAIPIVLGAFAICFISIAWFAMNNKTAAHSAQINTMDLPFDIATKGSEIRNKDVINSSRPELVEGTKGTFTDISGLTDSYYTGDNLILRFNPSVDDPETEIDESVPTSVDPGSGGELSLYIIPKTEDALNLKVNLNVVSFAEIEKKDASGNTLLDSKGNAVTEVIEIENATDFAQKANAINNTEAAELAKEYVKAAGFMKGHILFFGEKGDTLNASENLRYYYSNPLVDGVIDMEIPSGNKDKAVPIPIYWMWTNTLGQIALPDNIAGQRSGYPILSDTNTEDKEKITKYLIDNRAEVFANNSGNTTTYIYSVTTKVENVYDFDTTAFVDLSKGYNQADSAIGTRIAYFLIEVTVELVE